MDALFRGNGAPLPALPAARIWTIPDKPVWVVLLAPELGYWIHWIGRRSYPCLDDHCPKTVHRRPQHWIGYFPCLVPPGHNGLTAGDHQWPRAVIGLGAEPITDLRNRCKLGYPFNVRLARADSVRLVKVLDIAPQKEGLPPPPPFDVRPTLARVWGMRPPVSTLPKSQHPDCCDHEHAQKIHHEKPNMWHCDSCNADFQFPESA